MTPPRERFTYRMIRVDTGDWLQPSDDRRRLYRIHSFEDGSDFGLRDVRYRRRTFWRAVVMPMPMYRGEPFIDFEGLPDRWSEKWSELDWYLPTRSAGLDLAARHERERAA